jgi:hypothetical protein
MSVLNPGQDNFQKPKLDYRGLPISQSAPNAGETVGEYERRLEETQEAFQKAFFSGAFQRCMKNKHPQAKIVFACDHCETQDPVHPVGMVFSPFKYFLCTDCYKRHMRRKFELATYLKTRCFQCIMDECTRIKRINPTLVKDFTTEKPN